MSNHYHLLVETPKANLSQIMKHINGLYTQRYNRKHKKDGTLFRGRYKSVLVDEDSYLLQLTRYIHRNPLDLAKLRQALEDKPCIDEIMKYVEKVTKAKQSDLCRRSNGKQSNLPYRAFAIYACHRYSQADHNEIAKYFGLTHRGSISSPLSRIRKEISCNQWKQEIRELEKYLFIV